ncbi:MAG: divergent polysaccharide deacetylase family protein [Alphaproteobacteria bacterium]|nr:divergent polysaccharide deacetylase family protein [Alphaproteobacteria bacterium]NCQ88056.1 divergent polysaccharide deacetylase family protein [Alphaproteobacteria bacterium]NCT05437.1 divergent polysaccharide deacetylase family protein [Alphaproteobacteria bacterium]
MRFLKPSSNKDTIKFLAIAVALMLVVNYFVFDKHSYHDKIKEEYYAEQAQKQAALEAQKFDPVAQSIYTKNPPSIVFPEDGSVFFEAEPSSDLAPEPGAVMGQEFENGQEFESKPEAKVIEPEAMTPRNAKGGKIAIVIDDVGMNRKWSKGAIDLPSSVTLAFLPYADKVAEQAREAKSQGHEIIIHMPMEATDPSMDLGSMALRTGMSARDFQQEFDLMTQQLEGFVGINNHMGSQLTQDAAAMEMLMTQLKTRRLYFLDSRTIHTSIAAEMAQSYGVPYAVRDVFLDHEDTASYVAKALKDVERVAGEHGQAIAIGHPKEHTIKALKQWIPTLEEKGFEIVPLSDLLIEPSKPMPQAKKIEPIIDQPISLEDSVSAIY